MSAVAPAFAANPVVRTDNKPIHWSALVAGAFVTLALFVLSVVLAQACDVDITFRSAQGGAGETGAIIWGAVAAIVCFGIGSWFATCLADSPHPRAGWMQGLMVWAVVVPVLVYGVGVGIGPRLGQHSNPADQGRPFATAFVTNAMQTSVANAQPETTGSSTYISHSQAAAWWMILSLGLGLVASVVCGAVGGQMNHNEALASTTGVKATPAY